MSYLKKQPIQESNGMPHIYWNKGFTTDPNKPKVPNYTIPLNDYKLTKEQIWINRIKEWGFYIVITLLITYAIYRLIF